MVRKADRPPLPPYCPFSTLKSFIGHLKETVVPNQIDYTVAKHLSGSAFSALLPALKFLGLANQENRTTEELQGLVDAYGTDNWEPVLQERLVNSYSSIIGELNIKVATRQEIEQRFRATGIGAQVLQKCLSFYVKAMQDTGANISTHVLQKAGRPKGKRRKSSPKEEKEAIRRESETMKETSQPAKGLDRYEFPIPNKGTATLFLPKDLNAEDWKMVDTMLEAVIKRKQGE